MDSATESAVPSAPLCRSQFEVEAAGKRLLVVRLYPEDVDPKDAPLIFLHEGLGSIAQWKAFPEAVVRATGRPALIYDRLGFGGSEPLILPRPDDYLWQEATDALPELLEVCGVERPIMVGHSDGGTIALLYALSFPERPLASITLAAHVYVEEVTLAGIREAAEAWETTDLPKRLAKYHKEKTELVFRGWTETWLRPSFSDWHVAERLSAITCPLLVIQGEGDQYGTARQVETIVAQSSGPATPLIIPDCGHSPHLEQPDATVEAIAGFLAKVPCGKN